MKEQSGIYAGHVFFRNFTLKQNQNSSARFDEIVNQNSVQQELKNLKLELRQELSQVEKSVKYIKEETKKMQNNVINCQMEAIRSEQEKTLDMMSLIEQANKEKY